MDAAPRAVGLGRLQRRTLAVLSASQILGSFGTVTGISVGVLLAATLAGTEVSGLAQSIVCYLLMNLAAATAGALAGLVTAWSGFPALTAVVAVGVLPVLALVLRETTRSVQQEPPGGRGRGEDDGAADRDPPQ